MSESRFLANAIRMLSVDAVQKANSGHPGMPMGMADIAHVLWQDFLKHNPKNPHWWDRDRFILSNGHGSMLHYSLLHLTGYDISIEDLKQFRQLHSKTPGHPETITPGIEATTGPLGQGLANGVGMALAEKNLAATFNRPDHSIVDHYTYVFLGDGCLMEGISHEVASFAGTHKLSKLIAFWDDNQISIDGDVSGWFTDNTPQRFEAYGWQVLSIDGHDPRAIKEAIMLAQASPQPSLIACRTIIGLGSDCAGSASVHGAPLGVKDVESVRLHLEWPYPAFEIPEAIYRAWDAREQGQILEQAWEASFASYKAKYPELAREFVRRMKGESASLNWALIASHVPPGGMATRKASYYLLSQIGPSCPELIGGSADLSESNGTAWEGSTVLTPDNPTGNYLHYGVREFGMGAIMNGLHLHGGFIPYGGTFLTFVDYMRSSVRMSALMHLGCIFVFTHDSIGLGEDGPTHQPVEQICSLRMTPNSQVWRPADAVETRIAWQAALAHRRGPTCLLLSRQNLPAQIRLNEEHIDKGAYVLKDCAGAPWLILLSTGSEVDLCVQAANQLPDYAIRVVSMPCLEVFAAQDGVYKESVLPRAVKRRIAVEAGVGLSFDKYLGEEGIMIGVKSFGYSAPAADVFKQMGLSVDNIIKQIREYK